MLRGDGFGKGRTVTDTANKLRTPCSERVWLGKSPMNTSVVATLV